MQDDAALSGTAPGRLGRSMQLLRATFCQSVCTSPPLHRSWSDILMRHACQLAPATQASASTRTVGTLPRSSSKGAPGVSCPVCRCHFSAWPSSASNRPAGTTDTSAASEAASARRCASLAAVSGQAWRGCRSRCSRRRYRSDSDSFSAPSTALWRSSARAVSSSDSSHSS